MKTRYWSPITESYFYRNTKRRKIDVLLTDGDLKYTLCMARELGSIGLRVGVGSSKFNIAKYSKHVCYSFKYNKETFLEDITNELKKNNVGVLIAVGYDSNILCSKYKDKLQNKVSLIISNYNTLKLATNKEKMYYFNKKNRILQPKTWIINSLEDIKNIKYNSPMIIKSVKENCGKKVEYANNKKQIEVLIRRRINLGTQIVQEKIEGFSCGYFAFRSKGETKINFQHKRIRQYPYTGGTSSCAESYYDSKLKHIGEKILDNLNWEGIAMLEFIYNPKNKKYYFIEINCKYWGSLDLANSCHQLFALTHYYNNYGNTNMQNGYVVGKRFQWILPEDLLRIKKHPNKLKALKELVTDLKDKKVSKDISYLKTDMKPTLIRIGGTLIRLLR